MERSSYWTNLGIQKPPAPKAARRCVRGWPGGRAGRVRSQQEGAAGERRIRVADRRHAGPRWHAQHRRDRRATDLGYSTKAFWRSYRASQPGAGAHRAIRILAAAFICTASILYLLIIFVAVVLTVGRRVVARKCM
jgi:hypothetical protein